VSIFEGWPTKKEEVCFRAGVKAEHGRIINLFRDRKKEYAKLAKLADREGDDDTAIYYEIEIKHLDELIELIKGEQK